jgi:hypothetical protein
MGEMSAAALGWISQSVSGLLHAGRPTRMPGDVRHLLQPMHIIAIRTKRVGMEPDL